MLTNGWLDRIGIVALGLIGIGSVGVGGLVLMTGHQLESGYWTLPIAVVGAVAGVVGAGRSHNG